MLYLVSTARLEVIEPNFLESRCSYLRVEFMHIAVESAKKLIPVFAIQYYN